MKKLKELKSKYNTWKNKTDPEGLTNEDGIQMGIFWAFAIPICVVAIVLTTYFN